MACRGMGMDGNYSGSGGLAQITNNTVHDNSTTGIYASYDVSATLNTVYNQSAVNAVGIQIASSPSGSVSQNVVYGNYNGIVDGYYAGAGTVNRNRVYNNSNAGIVANNGSVLGNQVYSNG